jgi:hypothetical protein
MEKDNKAAGLPVSPPVKPEGPQGTGSRERDIVTVRLIIESAREMAKRSRELYKPALERAGFAPAAILQELQIRMELVMDCYLTGVAEFIKMVCGEFAPEPWREDYSHEERLLELLRTFPLEVPAIQSLESQQEPNPGTQGGQK